MQLFIYPREYWKFVLENTDSESEDKNSSFTLASNNKKATWTRKNTLYVEIDEKRPENLARIYV